MGLAVAVRAENFQISNAVVVLAPISVVKLVSDRLSKPFG
jgi:hypothetical protein